MCLQDVGSAKQYCNFIAILRVWTLFFKKIFNASMEHHEFRYPDSHQATMRANINLDTYYLLSLKTSDKKEAFAFLHSWLLSAIRRSTRNQTQNRLYALTADENYRECTLKSDIDYSLYKTRHSLACLNRVNTVYVIAVVQTACENNLTSVQC